MLYFGGRYLLKRTFIFRLFHFVKGTAGVALAGLLGTVRAQGRPLSDFVNQKIVVVGAGRYCQLFNFNIYSK